MAIIRTTFCALLLGGALWSQTFIQMSDPQFGMYQKDASFAQETANFDFAIATANRLKPAFLVITGDLVNKREDEAEVAEFKRIAAKLAPGIRLFNVAGNHDVGNEPTPESLAIYRERFGPDYYVFRMGDMAGFVVNSSLLKAPAKTAADAAKMEAWLAAGLAQAKADGVRNLIVFEHIPPFLRSPDEPETYDNFPPETRARFLKLLHQYGVKHLFAGHYHAPVEARDGDLQIHITGAVGMPLHNAKSGMRMGSVNGDSVWSQYFDLGALPAVLAPPAGAATH